MQFDRHNWNLALLLVRQAEGDGAGHRWMSQNGLLQFANVNRVAARLDHILHAPHQPDQAKAVARGREDPPRRCTGIRKSERLKKLLNPSEILFIADAM